MAKAARDSEVMIFMIFDAPFFTNLAFIFTCVTNFTYSYNFPSGNDAILMPSVFGGAFEGIATGLKRQVYPFLPYLAASCLPDQKPNPRHALASKSETSPAGRRAIRQPGMAAATGRSYYSFRKNSPAVLHVAALSSSSGQPLTCATTSEISFT